MPQIYDTVKIRMCFLAGPASLALAYYNYCSPRLDVAW